MLKFLKKLLNAKPVPEPVPAPASPRIAIPSFATIPAEDPFDDQDRADLHRFLTGTRAGLKLRYELQLRIHERSLVCHPDLRAHDQSYGYASACRDILDFATVTRTQPEEEQEGSRHHE
jgi:hypothetical protein